MLAVFTLIAFHLVSHYAGVPWPLALVGVVVSSLLVALFAYLKMHNALGIALVVLLGLLGCIIGQIGCVVVGSALVVLVWAWFGWMMVEVETVTRLTPKCHGPG